MPLLYSIDGGLVRIVVSDRVTLQETLQLTDALLADPGFESAADLLVDASRGRPSLSYLEMRTTATRWAMLAGRVRRIAIAAPSDVTYRLARAFQYFAELAGLTCRVFRSIPEARAWLTEESLTGAGAAL
jgi:SpoIIAA-like